MNRSPQSLIRFTILASAAVLLSTLLAGCGAGQITQTSGKHTAVGGINADVGTIAIRDAQLMAPSGSTWATGSAVPLSLYLSNTGTTMDRLVSVTSPVAQSMMMMPKNAPLPSVQPAATARPTPASVPLTDWQPLTLPPDSVMMLAPVRDVAAPSAGVAAPSAKRPGYAMLMGITEPLRAGEQITVTLRFEQAGPITLELPVSVPETPRPRASSEAEHAEH